MDVKLNSSSISPFKFVGRFFFLWNGVLFTTLCCSIFLYALIVSLATNHFSTVAEIKLETFFLVFGTPLITTCLGFVVTFYFFRRAYPRLAAAVSPALPTQPSQKELWKSWAICYWFAPLATVMGFAFGIATHGRLNHRGLAVTIFPVMLFVTSYPVYLRLKYLAKKIPTPSS